MALGAAASAALITYEGFDYANGPVDGQNGGLGWKEGWESQEDNPHYAVQSSSPLSFGPLVTSGGYLNGGGNYFNCGRRILTTASAEWHAAGRVSNPYSLENIDQGVVWASMLVRVNAPITSTESARVWFHEGKIAWDPRGGAETHGLQIRSNGGGPWSVSLGFSGPLTSTGVAVNVGTTYLFVIKFELGLTAGANSAYVWIFENPDLVKLGGEDLPVSTALASITGRDSADLRFQAIGFYLDHANDRLSVDEIRLGTSFADVTPVSGATSYALLGSGVGLLASLRSDPPLR
jgi:hypothetical protein